VLLRTGNYSGLCGRSAGQSTVLAGGSCRGPAMAPAAEGKCAVLASPCGAKEGWRGRKGQRTDSKCFYLGKASARAAQLAWLGFRLESRSRGMGDVRLSRGFMEFRRWLCVNSRWSGYTSVAGVIVALINALGMC